MFGFSWTTDRYSRPGAICLRGDCEFILLWSVEKSSINASGRGANGKEKRSLVPGTYDENILNGRILPSRTIRLPSRIIRPVNILVIRPGCFYLLFIGTPAGGVFTVFCNGSICFRFKKNTHHHTGIQYIPARYCLSYHYDKNNKNTFRAITPYHTHHHIPWIVTTHDTSPTHTCASYEHKNRSTNELYAKSS